MAWRDSTRIRENRKVHKYQHERTGFTQGFTGMSINVVVLNSFPAHGTRPVYGSFSHTSSSDPKRHRPSITATTTDAPSQA